MSMRPREGSWTKERRRRGWSTGHKSWLLFWAGSGIKSIIDSLQKRVASWPLASLLVGSPAPLRHVSGTSARSCNDGAFFRRTFARDEGRDAIVVGRCRPGVVDQGDGADVSVAYRLGRRIRQE